MAERGPARPFCLLRSAEQHALNARLCLRSAASLAPGARPPQSTRHDVGSVQPTASSFPTADADDHSTQGRKDSGRYGINLGRSRMRESRTSGSGAARLAAILAGASPANTRSPVHVVVISSGREGDQTAGSLEVRALWGRGDLVRSVKGGRATWQAVA